MSVVAIFCSHGTWWHLLTPRSRRGNKVRRSTLLDDSGEVWSPPGSSDGLNLDVRLYSNEAAPESTPGVLREQFKIECKVCRDAVPARADIPLGDALNRWLHSGVSEVTVADYRAAVRAASSGLRP